MENRTVYLVRNGKVLQSDNQRRYIGQIDLPLCEEGLQQARGLQKRFERADIKAAYCSDLERSRQTAEIIVGNKDIGIYLLKELREIALGDWDGRSFADIARQYPNEFSARAADMGYYRSPGGESFADCGKRVMTAFQEIMTKASGNILIVGHAGPNRVLLCHMLGMPLANLFRLGQDYGCINIIQCTQAGYQVKLMNYNRA